MFAVILNSIMTAIVGVGLSQMTMHVALCDDPRDCPVVFNMPYLLGIILAGCSIIIVTLSQDSPLFL